MDPGGVTMKFLAMQVSPRAAALSGAGVANPGRVSEISRNPLAMSVANEAEFGLSQVIFGEGGADNFVSAYYGLPIGEKYTLGLAVDFLGYDNIEGRDENGLKTSNMALTPGRFWQVSVAVPRFSTWRLRHVLRRRRLMMKLDFCSRSMRVALSA